MLLVLVTLRALQKTMQGIIMEGMMKKLMIMLAVMTVSAVSIAQQGGKTVSAAGASVYIVHPHDGGTVSGTFTVIFGLEGMGVAPAGVERDNTGHHHLVIDGSDSINLMLPLGGDVSHFGGGQTQTSLTLPAGKHTLQLILGDYLHTPHNPPLVSETITITVE